ncbi:F11 receptor, tandem duplicate 1 [Thalassophryne amazonica]|uniref:F11 receptor, tandem duplicate 1 n=1 Tax=Thalassophryne amazonica TaxID=390379 RepID=UPI0014708CEE|nr:F11 receptor, tandem duplicate 1 [Thalassophryne amazonica]
MFLYGLVSVALFLFAATGVCSFSVTTNNGNVQVKENEGTDLTCSYTGDFGSSPRVEWKFENLKGSATTLVFYDGRPTSHYADRVNVYGSSNLRFSKVTRQDTGTYVCEVSYASNYGEVKVKLTVLVPPSPPSCNIPTSVSTGSEVVLSCYDKDGSPPCTYMWYKDGTLLPQDPSKHAEFINATYKLNAEKGTLTFPIVTQKDIGMYYCEASNSAGPPQSCQPRKMEVRDVNKGGIIAAVIIVLLLLALLGLGIWYAYKKGYLPKKSESKPKPNVVYQPTSLYGGGDTDGDFKQKSSFVV